MANEKMEVTAFDVKNAEDIKKLGFALCSYKEKTVPYFTEGNETNLDKYVRYGGDNKYPNFLFNECYLKSTILQTIVNGTVNYIMGDGIDLADLENEYGVSESADGGLIKNVYWEDYVNEDGDSFVDIVKKSAVDYMIFGGFAILVNKNALGEVVDLQWLDFQNIRTNKDKSLVWYFENGIKEQNNYKTYKTFNKNPKSPQTVYYFNGHITRGVYPISNWNSAIASVLTSIEISKFHLSTIRKNFSGNFIINYNDCGYTEEQKKEISEKVKTNFQGADNAGSVMLAFNNGKENAVTVARIPEDNFDKKYDALKDSTQSEIFIAFGATPSLFGFNATNDVFSKEKFLEAFDIYNKTRVQSYQSDIERVFNRIFSKKAFVFKPFKIDSENGIIENNETQETME